jgi:hypothetical protein
MVGLAPGQTARLNALNLPGFQEILTVPCNITLSFVDDRGVTLKTATTDIESGKAVHLDMPRSEVNANSSRLQIRGVILHPTTPAEVLETPRLPFGLSGCSVAATLEIFDSTTGITTVVLESARGVPNR